MAEKPPDQTDVLVRRVYRHNGIAVLVEIDFQHNQVSLIDGQTFKPKKWIFGKREPDYKNGWLLVFEAMAKATELAFAELDAYNENKTMELAKLLIEVDKQLKKPEGDYER